VSNEQPTWRDAFNLVIREYRHVNLLADAAKGRGDREAFIDFCMILCSLARVCDEMIERDPALRPVWDEMRRAVRRDAPYDRIAADELTAITVKGRGMLTDET
jgi:hypothetical protein